MEKIFICHCGCGTVIWKDGDNEISYSCDDVQEIITFVDENGFINGKYSLSLEGLYVILQELQFMKNIQ